MDAELKKSILEYVLGKRKKLEIAGPPRLLATLFEAIEASKNLLKNLRNEKDSKTLRESLERRQKAAERFKNVTGEDWDI
jgi:hypothetical protein